MPRAYTKDSRKGDRAGRLIGGLLALALVFGIGVRGSTAEAPATTHQGDDPSAQLPVQSLHLPDEPGTVPLREIGVEAKEDAEAPADMGLKTSAAGSRVLPGNIPPLSIQDCQKALGWCQGQLKPGKLPSEVLAEEMTSVLHEVLNYLKIMDERHSTLADYEWIYLGTEKVTGNPIDQDRFDGREVDDASAISLHARYGDVLLHYVAILDDRGKKAGEYHFDPPLLLRAGLPRREVFYLYFPTRIKEVIVRYEGVDKRVTPRVDAYAGRTRDREYLKQAQFYLRRAMTAFKKGDTEETASLLDKTARRITKFQNRP